MATFFNWLAFGIAWTTAKVRRATIVWTVQMGTLTMCFQTYSEAKKFYVPGFTRMEFSIVRDHRVLAEWRWVDA